MTEEMSKIAIKAARGPLLKVIRVYKPPAKASELFARRVSELGEAASSKCSSFIKVLQDLEEAKIGIKDLFSKSFSEDEKNFEHRNVVLKLFREAVCLPIKEFKEWILLLDSHKVYTGILIHLLVFGTHTVDLVSELSQDYRLNIIHEPSLPLCDSTNLSRIINHQLVLTFLFRSEKWPKDDLRRGIFSRISCSPISLIRSLMLDDSAIMFPSVNWPPSSSLSSSSSSSSSLSSSSSSSSSLSSSSSSSSSSRLSSSSSSSSSLSSSSFSSLSSSSSSSSLSSFDQVDPCSKGIYLA